MAAKREWRKPTEADRTRKCRARNRFEKNAYYVEWNMEYQTWAMAGRPHILVRVDEVLGEPPILNLGSVESISTYISCDDAADALATGDAAPAAKFLKTLVEMSEKHPSGVDNERSGFIVEGALQMGFEMIDNNGDLLVVHTKDLVAFVNHVIKFPGAKQ